MIPIPEFPDYYACSDGVIWSGKANKPLKARLDRRGYWRVNLFVDGVRSTQPVHKLIAAAYLGPANGRHVLHGPKGSGDNSAENLRYGTVNDNMLDRYEFGEEIREWGEGYVPLLSADDVREISLYGADGVSDRQIAHWYCIPVGSVQPVSRNEPGSYRLLVLTESDLLEADGESAIT